MKAFAAQQINRSGQQLEPGNFISRSPHIIRAYWKFLFLLSIVVERQIKLHFNSCLTLHLQDYFFSVYFVWRSQLSGQLGWQSLRAQGSSERSRCLRRRIDWKINLQNKRVLCTLVLFLIGHFSKQAKLSFCASFVNLGEAGVFLKTFRGHFIQSNL